MTDWRQNYAWDWYHPKYGNLTKRDDFGWEWCGRRFPTSAAGKQAIPLIGRHARNGLTLDIWARAMGPWLRVLWLPETDEIDVEVWDQ